MTKRFKLGYACGDFGLIDNGEWIDLHSMSENSEKNVQICINKMNELADENEQLKQKLKKYEEIEELKKEDFTNCHNCKHDESVHDGVTLDGMCSIKGLMNIDGYFDVEYHRLPNGTICPYWELEE